MPWEESIWWRPKSKPQFKDGNIMSKLLLGSGGTVHQARAVLRAVSIYFVCTYVCTCRYNNTLGYRYECRAADPLGCQSTFPCWNNLVGQMITGNTPSDFFVFFLKIALRAWPIGSKSGRPLPQTESDSFKFSPRITCMMILLFLGGPWGSFQGSIKPWLWNMRNRPSWTDWYTPFQKPGESIGMRERGWSLDFRIL